MDIVSALNIPTVSYGIFYKVDKLRAASTPRESSVISHQVDIVNVRTILVVSFAISPYKNKVNVPNNLKVSSIISR